MKPPPLHGINGRLRRHITKVGAHHANRILAAKRKNDLEEDNFLRGLLDSGQITLEQLQKTTSEHGRIPSSFEWMQEVEDSVLDRADNVFLAKYGRDPTEDSDFRLNNDYYKICKNLQRIWQCYDADLEKLRPDYQERIGANTATARIVAEVKYINVEKGSIIKMLFCLPPLLFFGFFAYAYATLIPQAIQKGEWILLFPPILAIACFIVFFCGACVAWPRSVREKKIIQTCSQCGCEVHKGISSCPKCGVHF